MDPNQSGVRVKRRETMDASGRATGSAYSFFPTEKASRDGGEHVFEVQLYHGSLDPNTVRVELFADGLNGEKPVRQEMMRGRPLVGASGYIYSAQVASTRPAEDYTARVIPNFPGGSVPLESGRILWQR